MPSGKGPKPHSEAVSCWRQETASEWCLLLSFLLSLSSLMFVAGETHNDTRRVRRRSDNSEWCVFVNTQTKHKTGDKGPEYQQDIIVYLGIDFTRMSIA